MRGTHGTNIFCYDNIFEHNGKYISIFPIIRLDFDFNLPDLMLIFLLEKHLATKPMNNRNNLNDKVYKNDFNSSL